MPNSFLNNIYAFLLQAASKPKTTTMYINKFFLLAGILAATAAAGLYQNKNYSVDPVLLPVTQKILKTPPKIQAAILLDVSGSMDGLIDQAKAQLWNMVQVMGKLDCDGVKPEIEIALYEYGRNSNPEANGYIKLLSPFGSNLDDISQQLFSLTTNGGDEYCGQVIKEAVGNLKWSDDKEAYKVIFIAGNEDFLQGKIQFTEACKLAKEKNIFVNTVYCGDKMQGISEHWDMGGECGNGSYTSINQNAIMQDVVTPFDNELMSFNSKLNDTYLGYGDRGKDKMMAQAEVDVQSYSTNTSAALKRAEVKADKNIYKNEDWDLVDASLKDSNFYKKVDVKSLPAPIQNLKPEELKKEIAKKTAERSELQKHILDLSKKRAAFILADQANNTNAKENTLQSEIEKIITAQAQRFNMKVSK